MYNKPDDAPTDFIHAMSEAEGDALFDALNPSFKSTVALLDKIMPINPEVVFHDRADKPVISLKRSYDLHWDTHSAAPIAERFSCIDLHTFDGSEGMSGFIGRGEDRRAAMLDLLDKFGEFDEPDEPLTPDNSLAIEEQISEDLLNDR